MARQPDCRIPLPLCMVLSFLALGEKGVTLGAVSVSMHVSDLGYAGGGL
jgi:hypothetical protein